MISIIAEEPDVPYKDNLVSAGLARVWRPAGKLKYMPASLMKLVISHCLGFRLPYTSKNRSTPSVFELRSDFDAYEFNRPQPRDPVSGDRTNRYKMNWNEWFSNEEPSTDDDPETLREVTILYQASVARYTADIGVYLSEPDRLSPDPEYARMSFLPSGQGRAQALLIILFRSSRPLASFSAALSKHSRAYRPRNGGTGPPVSETWQLEQTVVISFYCVLAAIKEETDQFIQDCYAQIKTVVSQVLENHNEYLTDSYWQHISVRRSPSSYKAKFLLHVHDRVNDALQSVLRITKLLAELNARPEHTTQAQIPMPATPRWQDQRIEELHQSTITTLQVQKLQLQTLLRQINEDQKLLQSRLQLAQEQRLLKLTIFAAVFLPLSFTTSLFGMNINSSTKEGPSGFSEWINARLGNITLEENRIMTEVLGSITATSSSLNFSWTAVAATACGLLLTLPLAMAIDAIVRALVHAVQPVPAAWAAAAALVSLLSGIPIAIVTGISIVVLSVPWYWRWRWRRHKKKAAKNRQPQPEDLP